MIKANELRIGNWVTVRHPSPNDGDYNLEVKHITDEEIGTDAYGSIYGTCDADISSVKPIPLTKEWLVNFGFDSDGYSEFQKNKLLLDCEYTDKGEWIVTYKCIYIDAKIQFVHQLQNLYFALTGGELIYKP